MKRRNLLILSQVMLGCVAVVASRQVPGEVEKQRFERLKNAEGFSLELQPLTSKNGKPVRRFKSGKAVNFDLAITNVLASPVQLSVTDTYEQNRPQLRKDGEEIPYREQALKLIKVRDEAPSTFGERAVWLEPQQTVKERIELNSWYDPLDAGNYELAVRHRFVWGGAWLDSTPITFEVQPERQ